jgi:hypothetical protein
MEFCFSCLGFFSSQFHDVLPIAQGTLSSLRLSLDKYSLIRTGERDKNFKVHSQVHSQVWVH